MKWMTLELNEDQITLIALGLKELKKQNHFIIVGNEDKFRFLAEDFHNLSNGKVMEVTEAHMMNPNLCVNVIKTTVSADEYEQQKEMSG